MKSKTYKFATLWLLLAFATFYFYQGWMVAGAWLIFAAILFMAVANSPKAKDGE